jgi:hypothetical protein
MVSRRLEIYQCPVRDKTQLYGHRYADVMVLRNTEQATPLAAPKGRIKVADLLP